MWWLSTSISWDPKASSGAEIHSDLLFTAATVDADNTWIYLARPGEIYVADMTAKKPEPELLSTFDDSIGFDRWSSTGPATACWPPIERLAPCTWWI